MVRYADAWAVVVFLCIAFSQYHSSYSSQTLTQDAPPPSLFFPSGGSVQDFPYGNMTGLRDLVMREEFLFIMFYAPWCRRSKVARSEFMKAADVLVGRVKFISVNCFIYTGQCRQTLKLTSYPQFYAYHTTLNGYKFVGVHAAEYMVPFLERILEPITRLHDMEDMQKFIDDHNNAVIGYFEFGEDVPEPADYLQFYYAAMRVTALDVADPVRFGVTSFSNIGLVYNLTSSGDVVLMRRHDTTLKYSGNHTASELTEWLGEHRSLSLLEWVSPPHTKSSLLSQHITETATMILFTKHDPLWNLHPYYYLLEDIVEAYNDCSNTSQTRKRGATFYTRTERQYFSKVKTCRKKQYHHGIYNEFCASSNGKFLSEPCNECQALSNNNVNFGDSVVSVNLPRNMCIEARLYNKLCCDCEKVKPKGRLRFCNDPNVRSAKNQDFEYSCRREKLSYHDSNLKSSRYLFASVNLTTIKGLKCRTNRTLNFIAIDPEKHKEIFQRFTKSKDKDSQSPKIVIFDFKVEAHYVLYKPVSSFSIIDMIKQYTSGELPRTINGQSQPFTTTTTTTTTKPDDTIHITELTSSTFLPTVLDDTKVRKIDYVMIN